MDMSSSGRTMGKIKSRIQITKGIWEFLLLKMNEYYHTNNIRYFNQQQDLGIDLLRKSKEQNNHLDFLKKYKVSK